MTDDALIEKVARALCGCWLNQQGIWEGDADFSTDTWDNWTDEAKTAIEAARPGIEAEVLEALTPALIKLSYQNDLDLSTGHLTELKAYIQQELGASDG